MGLSAAEFAEKWLGNTRNERSAAQEHFIDLCQMLGFRTPNDDATGESFAFEKGADKTGGGDGFADVWLRDHFGWEYKGKHHDLNAAYVQLLRYREALGNPPLLVVCDLDRFIVHTNFNNTEKRTYEFALADLRDDAAEPLRVLRALFTHPETLKPQFTPAQITEAAASQFASIARSMQERIADTERIAHFLDRLLFCFFAEDAGLLPAGLLSDLLRTTRGTPDEFASGLQRLFALMSKDGGLFGTQRVQWFNGGLFDGDDVFTFTRDELATVERAAALDWRQVDPAVLGTLFERGLDPAKRGQLGAHYTDTQKISMVVEPVVMEPLRREFAALRATVEAQLAGAPRTRVTASGRTQAVPAPRAAVQAWRAFLQRLRDVRVLDPACGSGNFLYVTLRRLKDLEKEVGLWGSQTLHTTLPQPEVGPECVLGIELNPYAAELARVSIWIGHIQWMLENGFAYQRDPVLRPLHNIECRDAILAHDEAGAPVPAAWPDAEFIVGNPPFLGGKMLRDGLGDAYVDGVFAAWDGLVARESDLVCYWHEIARAQIERGNTRRAGLLSTNSIRGGANRRVLERIKESGDIFFAWSDEPWIVDGAAVRVSIVGQDDGSDDGRTLDGRQVDAIFADLTGTRGASVDITRAARLPENAGVSFMGDTKGGAFDIPGEAARAMLTLPANVNSRPNGDVIRPWVNGLDLTRRSRDMFIIDFGTDMTEADAAQYEAPFAHVTKHVAPVRADNRREVYARYWWRHVEARPAMLAVLAPLARFICTPRVSKHRLFVWLPVTVLPDSATIVIARDDDYAFGVLHSRAHERWSLRMGTWLGKGNDPRYTPTSTFETFPFPWPLHTPDAVLTSAQREQRDAIGAAARALDEARNRWLNPPEWVRTEPDVLPSLPPRLVAVDETAAEQLAKRTLTNLYNARPAWLAHLHRDLDAAVFAAYDWPEAPEALDDDTMLARLLALNLARAAGSVR